MGLRDEGRVPIGERLRAERDRLGVEQKDFAEQIGVSKNTQWNYEKGDRAPDAEYLSRAAALGVDVLYVLTGQRTPLATGLTLPEEKVLENYRALNEADKTAVTRLTDSLAESARKGQGSVKTG